MKGQGKKKKMTEEQKEAEENERRAEEEREAAAAAEEARYKHVLQLDFNTTTRDPMPSISPRDQLSYQQDKKQAKEIAKFREKAPELDRLLLLLRYEILKEKPPNIVRFCANKMFAESNEGNLRQELRLPPLEEKKIKK